MIELVLSAAIDCPNQSCPTVCSIHLQFLPSIRDQISIPSWRIFVLTLTIFQGTMCKLCTPHCVFVQKISGFFVFSLIYNNGFLVVCYVLYITTLFFKFSGYNVWLHFRCLMSYVTAIQQHTNFWRIAKPIYFHYCIRQKTTKRGFWGNLLASRSWGLRFKLRASI